MGVQNRLAVKRASNRCCRHVGCPESAGIVNCLFFDSISNEDQLGDQ